MKISVLLPTRGRTEVLKTSIMTLLDTVKDPKQIEIILGMDEDDQEVIEYVKSELGPILQEKGVETKANIFKPLGYENLHQYVNTLAGNASGDWLFFWNDDCLMETKDWDLETPSQEYFDELKRISKHQIIFGVEYINWKGLGLSLIHI